MFVNLVGEDEQIMFLRKIRKQFQLSLRKDLARRIPRRIEDDRSRLCRHRSAQQIQEDWNSLQAKIPSDFWAELKQQRLIEADATLPKGAEA